MDFFRVATKEIKGGALEIYPDFVVGRSKDLMIRGRSFYAVWDEEAGLWSTDEYDAQRMIDAELQAYAEKHGITNVKYTRSFSSNSWNQFKKYMFQLSDNSHQLNNKLVFAGSEVKKTDYATVRLPYSLEAGDYSAWDELVGTLYVPEEREKIEWAIGCIVSGDSRKVQKFLVFHGPPGKGKGTILDIIARLFEGYTEEFDAASLVGGKDSFSMAPFKDNPLVAIQFDGDLSRIQDNTKLNSIVSHEKTLVNEKFKPSYSMEINSFLFMGTNKPVRITDSKSGLIRRLIDVYPSGELFAPSKYEKLMAKIDFEKGAIAHHCLGVYKKLGRSHYASYRPKRMMQQTDVFFNFIEAYFDVFEEMDGISLKRAHDLYREYCSTTGIEKPLPQYKIQPELEAYFEGYKDRVVIDGEVVRKYFYGFKAQPFKTPIDDDLKEFTLVLEETTSLLDLELAEQPAQGFKVSPTGREIPKTAWSRVKTSLSEIDTSELHFVKVPLNFIVIDFDLRDEDGNKSLELNLEAASLWPATYAEISQSGSGVHLHYYYVGDVTELAQEFAEGIEIKTLLGDASLRRRLTKCNNVPVATINGSLPLKEKKHKMLETKTIKSEKGLRDLIKRNLAKEIHPGTKPSVDFINTILNEAYESGMEYDVTDMRGQIALFATRSTNHSKECLRMVRGMKFKGDESKKKTPEGSVVEAEAEDKRIVFFDVEVYPNLFVVCWKYRGSDNVVRMINPTAEDMEKLFKLKLVGFFNRRYDNHVIYARYLGYTLEQLFKLSQKLVSNVKDALFAQAYGLSYTDIYDFSAVKQSLKMWQIQLGLPHKEMDIPWDQPVPEDRIQDVVEYCVNDVLSTEATFEERYQDFVARQILADLSGLSVNHTTYNHTAQIIFEGDRNPQREFNYTHLERDFPGYVYDSGVSSYRDVEVVGEGGYVYAKPGIYEDVVLMDVESMHPHSIGQLDLFGKYTPNFMALVDAQLALKHGDYAAAKESMGGKLVPYIEAIEAIEDPAKAKKTAKTLREALKISINTVYGLTSASFDNAFRDVRNKDNIVAKRGALFMIDLRHFITEAGFEVIHIKTDSVKIPGAPEWLIEQIKEFGAKYGYNFEVEATYDKLCLVNDAVYIAKETVPAKLDDPNLEAWTTKWTAVGAQFQEPYVFKTLFSKEDVEFRDLCQTKQVKKGAIYMDFTDMAAPEYPYEGLHFVGKTGSFVPVREGYGGGTLFRVADGKHYAVSGTKGYRWVEAHVARDLEDYAIDVDYFERMADKAKKAIDAFGSYEDFVAA